MIVKSINVTKFRGFENLDFDLGNHLTVIAGQNGTQKTTLLGMLTQPFTIAKENPLYGERPLCGGNYKSSFAEKFKLSDTFDKPQNHEWTLNLTDGANYTVESIKRSSPGSTGIRFWKKGDKSKGSGYIQLPVIYLSLSRLFPIGEDGSLASSSDIVLTNKEFDFYKELHNKILIIPDVEMTSADYLASKQKNTLGANTSFYDWKMNSAGQDNIGKIILAILSFRRLQEKYGNLYEGGILAIDEIDTTLYPASQLKLIDALRKFSSQLKLQIIFTTHSLSILEKACEWQVDKKIDGHVKVLYLQKYNTSIKVINNISFDVIKNKLNVAISAKIGAKKIPVFVEDKEGEVFLKAIAKAKSSALEFNDCTLGCSNLVELSTKKITGFKFPQSLIILDGDVRNERATMKKINKLENVLILPGLKSPERLIAEFLYNLSDESTIWNKMENGYTKQYVFQDYSFKEILADRKKAKDWFNSQKRHWGRNCAYVINPWIAENQSGINEFLNKFDSLISRYKVLN